MDSATVGDIGVSVQLAYRTAKHYADFLDPLRPESDHGIVIVEAARRAQQTHANATRPVTETPYSR